MAFTEKVRGTYGFHEQTLKDDVFLVTNTTTRTLKQHELVLVSGVFGNVIEHKGIAYNASGLIGINGKRTIKTNQLAAGADFAVGNTVYAVAGTNSAPVGLTNTQASNTPVGIVTEIDPAATQKYVVFRPFVQLTTDITVTTEPVGVGTYVAVLEIDEDATGGIDFALNDIGMKEGAVIVDVLVNPTAAVGTATMQLKHGDSGEAITDAIAAAVIGKIGRAQDIKGGVSTDDGFTVVSNKDTAKAVISILYI